MGFERIREESKTMEAPCGLGGEENECPLFSGKCFRATLVVGEVVDELSESNRVWGANGRRSREAGESGMNQFICAPADQLVVFLPMHAQGGRSKEFGVLG